MSSVSVCGLDLGFNSTLILSFFSTTTRFPLDNVNTINRWNSSSNSFSFCLSPNLPPLNIDKAPVIKPDTGVLIITALLIATSPYLFRSVLIDGDNWVILPVNIAFAWCILSFPVSFNPFTKPYSLTFLIASVITPSPSACAFFFSSLLRLLLANVCSFFLIAFSSSVAYLTGLPLLGASISKVILSLLFGIIYYILT